MTRQSPTRGLTPAALMERMRALVERGQHGEPLATALPAVFPERLPPAELTPEQEADLEAAFDRLFDAIGFGQHHA